MLSLRRIKFTYSHRIENEKHDSSLGPDHDAANRFFRITMVMRIEVHYGPYFFNGFDYG